jgi:hypothetical protein
MTRVCKSIETNSDELDKVEVIFYIDDDDTDSIRQAFLLPGNIKAVIDEQIVLSQTWNKCLDISSGEIFMLGGDDLVFHTKGWDTSIREEFLKIPDRIGYVHANDGVHNGNIGTHGFVHQTWIDVVGHFTPPYFSSCMCDMWLTNISKDIKRNIYLPDVFIEHVHWINDRSLMDDIYRLSNMRYNRDKVRAKWEETEGERQDIAQKLLKYIEEVH